MAASQFGTAFRRVPACAGFTEQRKWPHSIKEYGRFYFDSLTLELPQRSSSRPGVKPFMATPLRRSFDLRTGYDFV